MFLSAVVLERFCKGNGFNSKESSSVLVPGNAEVVERHPTEVAR